MLRKNNFDVEKIGYFVYCNGRTDRDALNGKLDFDISHIFDEKEVDQSPKILQRVKPVYPYLAKELQKEGYVELSFVVSASGKVEDVKVLTESPATIFRTSAINAIEKWKFEPGKLKGKKVNTKMILKVLFQIDE